MLKKGEVDLAKGMNYLEDDLSIDNFAAEKLEQALNAEDKKNDKKGKSKKVEISKKKNGKYYLYKGSYTLKLTKGGITESQKLVVD